MHRRRTRAPPPSTCSFEQETDYIDKSIRLIRVSGPGHAPRTACCEACVNEPSCAVAVMDKDNRTGEGMACMLKATAVKKEVAKAGRVSCVPCR
jgi:hypothetical protein